MFNARQLMIFYFYGTCNQKATIIQFQKLKEKAKTEEPKKDIQDLIDFVAEYKDPDNYRWFSGSHGLILTCTVQKVRTAS